MHPQPEAGERRIVVRGVVLDGDGEWVVFSHLDRRTHTGDLLQQSLVAEVDVVDLCTRFDEDRSFSPRGDENVPHFVRITWHEIRRSGTERDEAAVGADRRIVAIFETRVTVVVDADALDTLSLPVEDENVIIRTNRDARTVVVRVIHNEVGAHRRERHEAAVAADRRSRARLETLIAVIAHADSLDGSRPAVDHENVLLVVRVARAEVLAQNEETKTEVENSTDDENDAASKAFRKKQKESHAELEEAVATIDSAKSAILAAEAERKAERRSELKETKAVLQSRHDEFETELADMTVKIEKAKGDAKWEASQKLQEHLHPFQVKKLHAVQEEGKWARWFAGDSWDFIGAPSGEGYWHDVGEVFIGYAKVPVNFFNGVKALVTTDPRKTAAALWNAAVH